MRIIKSALAVFLCLMLNLFRSGEGIVFYSCIAAVLCIQKDVSSSTTVACNRLIGTLHGGLIGLLGLLVIQNTAIKEMEVLRYLFISVMIVVVIYTTLLIKQGQVSYFACVVFLSICVSHGLDENPFLFAWNRILDTCIGILVALFVNRMALPFHRASKRLYLFDLETLLDENKQLDRYALIKLKHFRERGGALACYCNELPRFAALSHLHFPTAHPIICLHGAFAYDQIQRRYLFGNRIAACAIQEILTVLDAADCFTFSLKQDLLYVSYAFPSDASAIYIKQLHHLPDVVFVEGEVREAPFLLVKIGSKEELEAALVKLDALLSKHHVRGVIERWEDRYVLAIMYEKSTLNYYVRKYCEQMRYEETIAFTMNGEGQIDAHRHYVRKEEPLRTYLRRLFHDVRRRKS